MEKSNKIDNNKTEENKDKEETQFRTLLSCQESKAKQGFFSSIISATKKYYYSFQAKFNHAASFKFETDKDKIFLGGEEICFTPSEAKDQTNKRLLETLNNYMWFSYKRNWMMAIEGTTLSSDVGWGCMIRCGQMLLAKCIVKIDGIKFSKNSQQWKQILTLFNDNLKQEDAPFSIQNLVPYAKQAFKIEPGQWFRATSIMMSLDKMNEKYCNFLNKKLIIMTSVETMIGMNQIHDRIFKEKHRVDKIHYSQELMTRKWESQLLLCVAIRIGLSKPQDNFKKNLAKFMQFRQCLGMLGGKDHKAYLIIGYHSSKMKYYYLDPHYVQDADNPKSINTELYKPVNLFEYNYEDMVTSLMLTFHIKDEVDFKNFYEEFKLMISESSEDDVPLSLVETSDFDEDEGTTVGF